MQGPSHRSLLAILFVGICGCSEYSFGPTSGTEEPAAVEVADVASQAVDGQTRTDVPAGEDPSTKRVQRRIGLLFERVLPTLDQARELVDRHADLPDNSRVPFKLDKQSNSAQINELLDEAIEVLGISEVSNFRQLIRDSHSAISAAQENIADYQRQRVSASWAKDQSQLERVNPFVLSKEALDERIAIEELEIERQEANLVELKQSFADELKKIGLEVDQKSIESLLSSVSGDDIVTMVVVFDNIKHLTTQLQELTEDSGEALDVSKRYYGIYVVMIHVMDRIQKTFIRDIEDLHIPKLEGFAAQANQNIAQAKALIDADGGERQTLEANISSNRLTRETAKLYIEYLERNAALIAAENERAQRNLATAMNTYDTVKLSSDVAALMNTGRRNFDSLMKLQVPALRRFDNEAIRKEFQRMTSELRAGG